MTYLAFEGGEGSGKSTQARLLVERAEDSIATREPGATPLGAELRKLLLHSDGYEIDARTETLLMAADRAQHMAEVVEPALAAGNVVVSDRSVYSSLAYQGAGRELGFEAVRQLNEWAMAGRWPDLVVLLDVDRALARSRLNRSLDRLEQASEDFHQRVIDGYRTLAQQEPQRWVVVDAAGSVDDVAGRVWASVSERLGWE